MNSLANFSYQKEEYSEFEGIKHTDPDETEYWMGRELMPVLDYKKWERFKNVINKAILSCKAQGLNAGDHFDFSGEGNLRKYRENCRLTRFACYLVAQNGDVRKTKIALAQGYFAAQTINLENATQKISETPNKQDFPERALSFVERSLEKAGVPSGLIQSFLLDQCIKFTSGSEQQIFIEGKRVVASQSEIPSLPMTPTEVGELLGEKLGADAIKPRKVNLMLIEHGLQISTRKISAKSGKSKLVYELTKLGHDHGHIETTSAKHSDGTVVSHPRWFLSVIDYLFEKMEK